MARKPKIVRLRKGKVPDDSQFIETLVWVLDQARQGKVRGYAMAFIVEQEQAVRTIESASILESAEDALQLLGTIRCMEINLMKRQKMGAFQDQG